LYNSIGAELQNGSIPIGSNSYTIKLKNLPAGIYFLKTYNGKDLPETIKIIKSE
jgi:hypothetical protein